jgi:hypothetical protein
MNNGDEVRRRLTEKIGDLADGEASVVERFVDAIRTPVHSDHLPETWLATEDWRRTFAAVLQAYHALSDQPLATTQFEAAFNRACEAAGWHVEPARSATQRFYDTTISKDDGTEKRLSLKASSARDIRPDIVHISKLAEAAWIQDARKQVDRRGSIVEMFFKYQRETTAIFMLRSFTGKPGYRFFYELLEIPTSVFDDVAQLSIRQAREGTINIPPDSSTRDRNFAIRIDGSDAKITIAGIRIEICVVHGRWGLP